MIKTGDGSFIGSNNYFVIPAILRQAQDGERSRTKAGIQAWIPDQVGDNTTVSVSPKAALAF